MSDPVPEGVRDTARRVLAGHPVRPVEERGLRAWLGRDRGTLVDAARVVVGAKPDTRGE